MKKFRFVLFSLFLFALPVLIRPAYGQVALPAPDTVFAGMPTNPCGTGHFAQNSLNNDLYACDPTLLTWYLYSGGGGSALTVPGANVVTNSALTLVNEPILYADQFAGGDVGAKINAAIAALPLTGGTIDARGFQGAQTLSTPVTIGAVGQPVSVLFGAATFTQSAEITVSDGSSMVCMPSTGNNPGAGDTSFSGTTFVQKTTTNLAFMVNLAGTNSSIRDCTISGNQSNNATALDGIKITGLRTLLERVTTQNHKRHGAYVTSTALNNGAAAATFEKVMSLNNGGDGLFCERTTDVLAHEALFENNLGNAGAEMSDCSSARFIQSDFGGNSGYGLYIYGTVASWGSVLDIIEGNQFGNNVKHDLFVNGWDAGAAAVASFGHTIVGNSFIGNDNSITTRPNNTWDAINITDGGYNSISSNTIRNVVGVHLYRYGVNINDTTGSREKADMVGGGDKFIVASGTGNFHSSAGNTSFCSNSELDQTNSICNSLNIGFGTGAPTLTLNGAAGNNRIFFLQSGGLNRWSIAEDNAAESGANAGSDLRISTWTDAGGFLATPFIFTRSNGNLALTGTLKAPALSATNLLISATAPTVSSGFGTGASVTANNGTAAFLINVGTSNSGTGVIALPTAVTGWNCFATDITNTSTTVSQTKMTGSTTATATLQNYTDISGTHAWVDSDVLAVSCFAY